MSAVAPAAALSMELLLSSQQRQQLTPLQYAGLQTALRSVLAASTKQATATLLLCIALESAAQLLLDTGGVQARQTAVTQLLHWLDKERPAIRAKASLSDCWNGVARLLTTPRSRAFWTEHAKSIKSIGQVEAVASLLLDIQAAKPSEDEQEQFFRLVLEQPRTVRFTKAFIIQSLPQGTALHGTAQQGTATWLLTHILSVSQLLCL